MVQLAPVCTESPHTQTSICILIITSPSVREEGHDLLPFPPGHDCCWRKQHQERRGVSNIRREEEYLAEVLRTSRCPDHVIRSAARAIEGRHETSLQWTFCMYGLVVYIIIIHKCLVLSSYFCAIL